MRIRNDECCISASLATSLATLRIYKIFSDKEISNPNDVKNASAAPAQASERPGGRSKGMDEVPPVLGGPDIV